MLHINISLLLNNSSCGKIYKTRNRHADALFDVIIIKNILVNSSDGTRRYYAGI